jgi:hypothetical protein
MGGGDGDEEFRMGKGVELSWFFRKQVEREGGVAGDDWCDAEPGGEWVGVGEVNGLIGQDAEYIWVEAALELREYDTGMGCVHGAGKAGGDPEEDGW